MSRTNNPQRTIAYGVSAGLAAATVFTAEALMLFYNAALFPSSSASQNGANTTTTQSPSQSSGFNQVALALPATVAFLSLLAALYFALRYARDEITTRQRQLAVASGSVGMLAIADAVALPVTAINLRSSQIPVGVTVGVITPAFLAVYIALSYGAYFLYAASQQPDQNGLNQPLTTGGEAQRERGTNSESDSAPRVMTTGLGSYGAMWPNNGGQENVDNGSQSSMSTVNSARRAASVDTTYGINNEP